MLTENIDLHQAKETMWQGIDLADENRRLEKYTAEERIEWALEHFKTNIVLSSSFGAQAAVSLHMATQIYPDIPVILIDTGYLFPETYQFIDELTERFQLNLKTYRARMSPAWQEARYGKLWENGIEGIEQYNLINKVVPMQNALEELNAKAWIAGLRRQQSSSRQNLSVIAPQDNRLKVHPIIDWTDKDIFNYLTKHGLPYHPLWHEGYISIGDVHTTRKLTGDISEEDTRFFGLKRECGLHETTPIDFSI
ncbi:MAG: phosphoadenylyl-sulfate reductase [Verrucomicrobiota bacterium]